MNCTSVTRPRRLQTLHEPGKLWKTHFFGDQTIIETRNNWRRFPFETLWTCFNFNVLKIAHGLPIHHCIHVHPGKPQENKILEDKLSWTKFSGTPSRVLVCGPNFLICHLETPVGLPICQKRRLQAAYTPLCTPTPWETQNFRGQTFHKIFSGTPPGVLVCGSSFLICHLETPIGLPICQKRRL